MSVVKVKEAHKQIEDIEKLRKQTSIQSILQRISSCFGISRTIVTTLIEIGEEKPNMLSHLEIKDSDVVKKYLDNIISIYESIRYDLQKTLDIKEEDFNKLFPNMKFTLTTYASVTPNLNCLNMKLLDIRDYCQRLL
jgi:hypothetical protein